MNILLTGGAGFIGYHVTELLLSQGHRVVSVDNLNPYYDPALKKDRIKRLKGKSHFFFHEVDILNYQRLVSLAKQGFDQVVHLAAVAGVRYALDHGIEYVRTNYEGTFNVFELARHYRIPKVVYASSSSVYGETGGRMSHEEDRVDTPASLYGATKKADEELAYSYHHLFGIRSIGLRFSTVYGPWGRPDMALFLFTAGILNEQPIDVYNYGKQQRSFTYVDDVTRGIRAAMDYDAEYEIFNLGNDRSVPLFDFIAEIEKATGKKAQKHLMPAQLGDLTSNSLDLSKAKRLLGYAPQVDIEEGVPRFVAWYKEYYR